MKTQIIKVENKNSKPLNKLILNLWLDEELNSILWDYGNATIKQKNIYEIIGILEAIQNDLLIRLNEDK